MSRLEELIKELCPDGVEYRKLEDCCNVLDRKRKPITKAAREAGEYPYYGANGIQDYVADYIFEGKFILVGEDGSVITPTGIPVVNWAEGKIWVNNHAHIIEELDGVLLRYLYHYLQTIDVTPLIHGNIPKLTGGDFKALQIPVPPLEIQREIVRILDNFTSLKAELQAELQARKKQYEYYRDQLLSFDSVHGGGTDECEWRTLGEVFDIRNGYTPSKSNDEFWKNGTIPWFRMEDIRKNGRILSDSIQKVALKAVKGELFPADSIIVATSATVGEHALIKCKSLANQRFTYLVLKDEYKDKFNIKFLFYYCYKLDEYCLKCLNQSNFASVDMSKFRNFKFPIISLGTQERIVEVLDNFDAICSDLNIGLPAEIEARQKQYEYYRDALLSFDNSYFVNVERERERERDEWHSGLIKLWQYVFGYAPVKLKDIATISRGGNFQKKDFVKIGKPCIHYGQMYTHFGVYADKTLTFVNNDVFAKSKTAKPGDIVMAVTSENVEDVCSCTAWLGNEEIAVSGHTAIISHNQNAKYMSYFFHSASFFEQKKRLAHGTKVIEVTPVKLGDIKIMLPTLKEQERIVSILDRFDSLCNDISSGLPAEIEARQKQYEYYRDKLLSF